MHSWDITLPNRVRVHGPVSGASLRDVRSSDRIVSMSKMAAPPSATSSGWVPQHHRDITLGRLEGFTSKESLFADVNLRSNMYLRRAEGCCSLEVYSVPKGW